MLKLSFTGGSLSSYNGTKRKINKLVSNAKQQGMRRVPQRCLERDAGRVGRGISAKVENFQKPWWISG